jgi:hypothetical protein
MHGRWPGIPTVQVTGSRRVRMGDQQKYIYRNPCQLKLEMTITRLIGLEIGAVQVEQKANVIINNHGYLSFPFPNPISPL